MNDFTKEELHTLIKCIRLAEIDHGECSDLDNVKFKIQSLIDHYCENEIKGEIIDYKHTELEGLINKNQQLLFIMGVQTTLLLDMEQYILPGKSKQLEWVLESIENVVYKDKNILEFPDI